MKRHWEHIYTRIFTVSSRDLRYILVCLIKKSSTLENKIRDQFTVKSGHSNMLQQHAKMGETMTFFLQIKLRLVKCNHYLIQVFVFYENMLAEWQRTKDEKINDKMESITSGWFFLSWFQHVISKVLKNKEISCFTHKPTRV